MPDPVSTTEAPVVSTVTPVEVKPADVVAAAAKEVEVEETLLGEKQKEESKETPAPVKAAPEKYDFKVPEGMQLDTALVDKITPIFKELDISQEKAQKLVDAYAPYVKDQMEAQKTEALNSFKEMVNEWKLETQKELGANAVKELAYAAKAITNLTGSPEEAAKVKEFLNETGVGNNIVMARLLINAGKRISEDKFAEPNKTITGKYDDPKSFYDHPTSQSSLK